MKAKLLISFIIILSLFNCIPLVIGATSSIINVNYDFSNTYFIDGTVYKTDSIVLRIKTSVETVCKYGTNPYPTSSFTGEYGLTHETYLEGLEEGLHKYYVICQGTSSPVMEINFATAIPIYAILKISENPPLKEGKYRIELITSKTSLGTPTLEYSFDEIVYKPISLKGSGTNWEGNLIIPISVGEGVCSFRFKAKDLAGEEGTKIIGDNLFIVDTLQPSTIEILNAEGDVGQINLNWFSEEDLSEFNIYRSENPGVDYTNLYESSNKDYFYDNDVEKGKTYYYKVVGVDEAGNIGDLSKEVYATALFKNYSSESGLNPKLVGKVDNFITEVNSVIEDIEDIDSLIELKEEKQKEIFKSIKLDKELEGVISELNSLKRDVENYKLQDLSEEELNKKISSASLKLNILKKKVPEDITILEEKQVIRDLSEENIQRIFLEYSSNLEYDYKKEIAETLKLIKEDKISVNSEFYIIEIMYLDGTKKDITLVKESINSEINYGEELSPLMVIPKEIVEKASELKIMNLEYEVIKEDPVILFNSNVKEILYYINKEISLDSLENSLICPIKISSDELEGSKITGNSILDSTSKGSLGIIALIIFAVILAIYFLKIKNDSSIKPLLITMENLKKIKELINEGKEEEAKQKYNLVKEEYKNLSDKEKEIVIEGVKKMGETLSK
ncbi:MAG: fibronectin type III domain-containing protein [Nanobdellota archaeon]